jgi:hypothetical protein
MLESPSKLLQILFFFYLPPAEPIGTFAQNPTIAFVPNIPQDNFLWVLVRGGPTTAKCLGHQEFRIRLESVSSS